jgi:hypothetical protein
MNVKNNFSSWIHLSIDQKNGQSCEKSITKRSPLIIYLDGHTLLKETVKHYAHIYESIYFQIEEMTKISNIIKLRVLKPIKNRCNNDDLSKLTHNADQLVLTNQFILINVKNICALQIVDLPIINLDEKKIHERDVGVRENIKNFIDLDIRGTAYIEFKNYKR